ncbi:MAG: DUF4870 domain-containing protein [Bacteroidota bacterium]|nr:DUF4870 domain-containing protein [Bacteroidota bacterium]
MEEFNTSQYWGMDEKTFLTIMHISQFAGLAVPFGGFALPLVMWLTNKEKNSIIDEHGKNIINWIISATIYAIVGGILAFIIVGFVVLIAVAVACVVYPIIGAIRASKNEIWEYPLTIKFIQ